MPVTVSNRGTTIALTKRSRKIAGTVKAYLGGDFGYRERGILQEFGALFHSVICQVLDRRDIQKFFEKSAAFAFADKGRIGDLL